MSKHNTIVIGASDNPERYSYKAMIALGKGGHSTVGVHPKLASVCGVAIYPSIELAAKALGAVDTITMYVGAKRSEGMAEVILATAPKRVIFNPGAENEKLSLELQRHGILCRNACTLVLLATGQY